MSFGSCRSASFTLAACLRLLTRLLQVEFGPPKELLDDPSGLFARMVAKTSPANAAALRRAATASYMSRRASQQP
jgi:hypothetical protein